MKFKKGFLMLCLCFSMLFSCIVVSAADNTIPVDYDKAISFVSQYGGLNVANYNYRLVYFDGTNYQYVFCSEPIINSSSVLTSALPSSSVKISIDASGNYVTGSQVAMLNTKANYTNYYLTGCITPLDSSHDILNSDGTIFFHKPVPVLTQAQIVQKIPLNPVLLQVVFLAKLLIVSIVGFLAFRKAWAWLKTELLQA